MARVIPELAEQPGQAGVGPAPATPRRRAMKPTTPAWASWALWRGAAADLRGAVSARGRRA
jgi:hypothetical protein